jgi:hypothetical protein
VVGEGRIVYDTKGIHETSFKWGLGEATNNQHKALALFQGLGILNPRRIKSLLVIRDPLNIFRHMHYLTIRRTVSFGGSFIEYKRKCEILSRDQNFQPTHLANKASHLNVGILRKKQGTITISHIPKLVVDVHSSCSQ